MASHFLILNELLRQIAPVGYSMILVLNNISFFEGDKIVFIRKFILIYFKVEFEGQVFDMVYEYNESNQRTSSNTKLIYYQRKLTMIKEFI